MSRLSFLTFGWLLETLGKLSVWTQFFRSSKDVAIEVLLPFLSFFLVMFPFSFRFYGRVEDGPDGTRHWVDTVDVVAMAYDTPIPGYDTYNTLNVRLWSAKPSMEFDLEHFNRGNFFESIKGKGENSKREIGLLTSFFFIQQFFSNEFFLVFLTAFDKFVFLLFAQDRQQAEQITQVLYPNDNTPEGKELRLKQQYFFVSATLQDLLRRFRRRRRPIQVRKKQVFGGSL